MPSTLRLVLSAGRSLLKRPGFTLVAASSLALGIGVTTVLFSVIDTALLKPLPVEAPERLVAVYTEDAQNPGLLGVSHPNFHDYAEQCDAFSGLAIYQWVPVNLASGGAPMQVFAQIVSASYFSVLGVRAEAGRTFQPADDSAPGAARVVVLSHGLWQRRFGSDPRIVGSVITVDRQPFTVVGVAAKGFRGTDVGREPQLWVPSMTYRTILPAPYNDWFDSRRAVLFNVLGRLRPGVSVQEAEARLRTISSRLEREFPDDNRGRSVRILPLAQATLNPGVRDRFTSVTGFLMGAAALVLLIACGNVISLSLARAVTRRREIGIRLCLGAQHRQLVQQLAAESALLALLAGALGLLLTAGVHRLLLGVQPTFEVPVSIDLAVDHRVLIFTLALSLGIGLLFGLVPALQASRPDLVSDLKGQGPGAGRSSGALLCSLLVIGQIGLCFFCLTGAGLFLKGLRSAQRIDPGFQARGLACLSFNGAAQGYSQAQVEDLERRILARVRQLPGVRAAALAQALPLAGGSVPRTLFVEGQTGEAADAGLLTQINAVSPDYFRTLGIPLLSGRDFAPLDHGATASVAVVNETAAKRFWPGGGALGKRVKFYGDEGWHTVIGVVKDSKYNQLGEEPQPYVYTAMLQDYSPRVTLFTRAAGDPAALLGLLRREVQAADPTLPLVNVSTFSDILGRSLWASRLSASLLGLFGLLALALAILGVFSVTSYALAQRRHEMGMRIALGAQRRELYRMILGQVLRQVLVGFGFGLIAALGASKVLQGLLFGVSPTDAATLATAALTLGAAAFLAVALPARRATLTDPLAVLRPQ